jgi:hypothetical protein
MQLRKLFVTAALGATVLASVPALVAPTLAHADDGVCATEGMTCTTDDPTTPDDPTTVDDPDVANADQGNVGDPDPGYPQIVITGQRIQPTPPSDPPAQQVSWNPSPNQQVVPYKVVVPPHYIPQNCYQNNSSNTVTLNQTFTYQVSYTAQADASLSVLSALSASLGVTMNTQTTQSYSASVTLAPGQSFALNVQYEILTYAVVTPSSIDLVNVLEPTGNVMIGSC